MVMKKSLMFGIGLVLCSVTAQASRLVQTERLDPSVGKIYTALDARIDGARAHWVDLSTLLWDVPESASRFRIHYSAEGTLHLNGSVIEGGSTLEVMRDPDSAWRDTKDVYRHIRDWPTLRVEGDEAQVRAALRSQVLAAAYDESGNLLQVTHIQTPGVIDALFTYGGKLGPDYANDGTITVRLWAPTAQRVQLIVYDVDKRVAGLMDPVEAGVPFDGVWIFRGGQELDRLYYRFSIQVYHYIDNGIHEYEVTDPYSVSLSTNSVYSQFVNLEDDDLKPAGWDSFVKKLPEPTDISVYEGHIRDFSIWDYSVPEQDRGTYRAFLYNGEHGRTMSTGMAHLKRLSEAGLTHLHLLPLNDISTVQEDPAKRIDLSDPYERICELIAHPRFREGCDLYGSTPISRVFEQLAQANPVTYHIQEPYLRIGHHESSDRSDGLASYDGFNWGYDPYHFNAPEGSYATDPEGTPRILQLREMVKSLHEIGLLTVVDVVYNHTSAAGISDRSVLDKVVPGYYMRRTPDTGVIETSTCCQNTAAEFNMMEKLMTDSILLWAKEYKIDSFRFDLMGHHPVYVMENILEALTTLNVQHHGVQGDKIYVYGEGWNFGEVADDRIYVNATQFNLAGTGIGNFNDRNRDAIRGGMFSDWVRNQGFTSGQYVYPNEDAGDNIAEQKARLLDYADRIRVGLAGNLKTYRYINRFGEHVLGENEGIGYTLHPGENVNYIDKHDNESLWDNTQPKLPMDMTMWDRVYVHTLSQAIINYSQGIPFHQMGTDILRSKSMDRNSYDSGDWFNRVDFSMETHNWATGMPPKWDNERRWAEQRKHLENPLIKVDRVHMEWSHRVFMDQLNVRYSSPLFRLGEANEVHRRIRFHNTGIEQVPGLIIMSISDSFCAGDDLDPALDGIMVLFNALDRAYEYNENLDGFRLHPVLQQGADQRYYDITAGLNGVTVPPHSALVLVKPQVGTEQGPFWCTVD